MISEQTVLDSPVLPAVSSPLRMPASRLHVADVGAALHRLTGMVGQWLRIPALPYAALWEASLVVGQLRDQKTFEADPFSTEMPFLIDSWLRG